ncbi:VWA domain-containing protein [Bacteriovorax sp. Seq25_V]|uniref:VWA domain-containing protein n=1 Tax=Bacteriovorax sp. Seq25_V TaxID=1201288 RepID=UPI00038A0DFD|nr:VWA domain-containing protein [Bacteriovorax sp. Seq25_V]EQC44015.1 von Willebrand factor type A domain protein [Bacteriovorax sp. Seq25_V]
MKRKEINVFNISFLDLLSGALGAVIILFISVPKNEAPEASSKIVKATCTNEEKLLKQCLTDNEDQKKIISEGKLAKEELEKKVSSLQAELEKIKTKAKEESEIIQKSQSEGDGSADTGFNFKGKNIVFIIDVSGSMQGEKIGQVKAGLKMLIASMGKEYKVDVVYYPHSVNQDYYSLWGVTQSLHNLRVKEEVYDFLNNLVPKGNTPTRSAMLYAMSNYKEATDIVLLSDGLPTISGSRKVDDYKDLIKDILWHNGRSIQINTIGVGKMVFSSRGNDLYKFLKELSEKTNGFFYGF